MIYTKPVQMSFIGCDWCHEEIHGGFESPEVATSAAKLAGWRRFVRKADETHHWCCNRCLPEVLASIQDKEGPPHEQ